MIARDGRSGNSGDRLSARMSFRDRDVSRSHAIRSRLHTRVGRFASDGTVACDEAIDPNFNISDEAKIDACGIGNHWGHVPPLGALYSAI